MLLKRNGFTMIDLLIVIIIIGVLAAFAVPRFTDSKKRAYIAAMESDLRNIVPGAESKFSEDATYANYVPAAGSSGITITFTGARNSWEATARHSALPGVVCRIERDPAVSAVSEPVCQ